MRIIKKQVVIDVIYFEKLMTETLYIIFHLFSNLPIFSKFFQYTSHIRFGY